MPISWQNLKLSSSNTPGFCAVTLYSVTFFNILSACSILLWWSPTLNIVANTDSPRNNYLQFGNIKLSHYIVSKTYVFFCFFFIRTPKFKLRLDVLIFLKIFSLKCSYWRSWWKFKQKAIKNYLTITIVHITRKKIFQTGFIINFKQKVLSDQVP